MHRFLHTVSARIRTAQPTCPPTSAESGETADLAALYDACAGPVYQYLFYRTLKTATAESLTEQVFRRGFALVRDRLVDTDAPLPWLFRLAESVHADQDRQHAAPASDRRLLAEAARDEHLVTRAAACISPEELQVVVLRFGQRLDRTQAARRLRVASTDIARLEVQALRTLSECLRILRELDGGTLPDPARGAPHGTN